MLSILPCKRVICGTKQIEMKKILFVPLLIISIYCKAQYDTLNYNNTYGASPWSKINYYVGSTGPADGWVIGVNTYNQKEKAQVFTLANSLKNKVEKVWIFFGIADTVAGTSAEGKYIRVKVYDQNNVNLNPQNLLGSEKIDFRTIIADVKVNKATEVTFTTPVIIPAGDTNFFVSVACYGDTVSGGNLDWNTRHDSLSVYTNTIGQPNQAKIWQKHANDSWCDISSTCGPGTVAWAGFYSSMWIFPLMTSPTTIENNNKGEWNIIVYPNPAQNNVYIKRSNEITGRVDIKLINTIGQVVETIILDNNQESITVNIEMLPKGIYILQSIGNKGEMQIGNLIIN